MSTDISDGQSVVVNSAPRAARKLLYRVVLPYSFLSGCLLVYIVMHLGFPNLALGVRLLWTISINAGLLVLALVYIAITTPTSPRDTVVTTPFVSTSTYFLTLLIIGGLWTGDASILFAGLGAGLIELILHYPPVARRWYYPLLPELRLFEITGTRPSATLSLSQVMVSGVAGGVVALVLFGFRESVGSSWPVLGSAPAIIVAGFICSLGGYAGIAFLFRSHIRHSLRRQLAAAGSPVCVPCGFDLSGTAGPTCPECGTVKFPRRHKPNCR